MPKITQIVKTYATHEEATFKAVTKAHSTATSFQITPEVLNDQATFEKFEQVQAQLATLDNVLSQYEAHCSPVVEQDRAGRHRGLCGASC